MSEQEMQDLIISYNMRLSKLGYKEEQSKKLSAILLEMHLWQVKHKVEHKLDFPEQCQYGWFIQSEDCGAYYLHTDGLMKWGADESENNSIGYFNTYNDAWMAKEKYELSNN